MGMGYSGGKHYENIKLWAAAAINWASCGSAAGDGVGSTNEIRTTQRRDVAGTQRAQRLRTGGVADANETEWRRRAQ